MLLNDSDCIQLKFSNYFKTGAQERMFTLARGAEAEAGAGEGPAPVGGGSKRPRSRQQHVRGRSVSAAAVCCGHAWGHAKLRGGSENNGLSGFPLMSVNIQYSSKDSVGLR